MAYINSLGLGVNNKRNILNQNPTLNNGKRLANNKVKERMGQKQNIKNNYIATPTCFSEGTAGVTDLPGRSRVPPTRPRLSDHQAVAGPAAGGRWNLHQGKSCRCGGQWTHIPTNLWGYTCDRGRFVIGAGKIYRGGLGGSLVGRGGGGTVPGIGMDPPRESCTAMWGSNHPHWNQRMTSTTENKWWKLVRNLDRRSQKQIKEA